MFVGLQLYSVHDAMESDFEGTLKTISEMGYDSVEFAGLHGHKPEEVKELCRKYHLNPISAHVTTAELDSNPSVFAEYASIGCKYLGIPYLPNELRPATVADVRNLTGLIKEYSQKSSDAGLQLLYHNHDYEFKRLDNGEYMLDALFNAIPAEYLQTELDTCWVRVCGEDPVAYIHKYSGRAPIVHVKDFFHAGAKAEGKDKLNDSEIKKIPRDETFSFRPLGYGLMNILPVIQAVERAGTRFLIVEQDHPTPGEDPIEEVRKSREYLKSLGY